MLRSGLFNASLALERIEEGIRGDHADVREVVRQDCVAQHILMDVAAEDRDARNVRESRQICGGVRLHSRLLCLDDFQ